MLEAWTSQSEDSQSPALHLEELWSKENPSQILESLIHCMTTVRLPRLGSVKWERAFENGNSFRSAGQPRPWFPRGALAGFCDRQGGWTLPLWFLISVLGRCCLLDVPI